MYSLYLRAVFMCVILAPRYKQKSYKDFDFFLDSWLPCLYRLQKTNLQHCLRRPHVRWNWKREYWRGYFESIL